MSHSRLSEKDRLLVWLRAGGRCQYPGCNTALWRDDLTLKRMNRAYLAHIIADKPEGPRGDSILSPKLCKDPSNIMLLCDAHHRLIDKEDVDGHPVELLQNYKQAHEERIKRLTAMQRDKQTHIVLFSSPIGYREGRVSFAQARDAILPNRYPATETGIRLELCGHEIGEEDAGFYPHMMRYVERSMERVFRTGSGPTGKPLTHLSIFALAPIPALIYFGKLLGDIRTADVYQRHRCSESWQWRTKAEHPADNEFLLRRPNDTTTTSVVINVSLSNIIDPHTIKRVVSEPYAEYQLTIARPRPDFLATKQQLTTFRTTWRTLLSEIRAHGRDAAIHVFPAVPNAIAVEMGRLILPKTDTPLRIYDDNRSNNGFTFALQI